MISDKHPDLLLLFGLIVLTTSLLLRILQKKKKAAGKRLRRTSPSVEFRAKQEIEKLIVELEEIGRVMYARLDTRIRHLNHLLAEADQRIARLGQHAKEKESHPPMQEAPAANDLDERYQDVYRLSDNGASLDEITRKTNRHKGEIELILHLRSAAKKDMKIE